MKIYTFIAAALAANMISGCSETYLLSQHSFSAKADLNQMGSSWVSFDSGAGTSDRKVVNTSYLVSDVHYSMASPMASPETVGDTTAILVNTAGSSSIAKYTITVPNALRVLEFGTQVAPTSTENTSYSASGDGSWAAQLAKPTGYKRLNLFTRFDSIKDVGNDSILSWGRWTGARFVSAGVEQAGCCSENKSAHYVFGAATPDSVIKSMPRGFTAADVVTFNLIGATSPTLADGSFAPGTLNATTSKVGVLWGGASALPKIGVELYGTINNLPFTVKSLGGASTPFSTNIVYNPATLSFSGDNKFVDGSKVSGFFAGKDATHIGLTYTASVQGFTTFPGIREVQGAAAFKRP